MLGGGFCGFISSFRITFLHSCLCKCSSKIIRDKERNIAYSYAKKCTHTTVNHIVGATLSIYRSSLQKVERGGNRGKGKRFHVFYLFGCNSVILR